MSDQVSKQLAISASASIFTMAAFALFASPMSEISHHSGLNQRGAATEATAPAVDRSLPGLFELIG